jgi:hypothetical protein
VKPRLPVSRNWNKNFRSPLGSVRHEFLLE